MDKQAATMNSTSITPTMRIKRKSSSSSNIPDTNVSTEEEVKATAVESTPQINTNQQPDKVPNAETNIETNDKINLKSMFKSNDDFYFLKHPTPRNQNYYNHGPPPMEYFRAYKDLEAELEKGTAELKRIDKMPIGHENLEARDKWRANWKLQWEKLERLGALPHPEKGWEIE